MRLMTQYQIDDEDKGIASRAGIEISTYIGGTFIAEIAELDQEFANSINLRDIRVEGCSVWLILDSTTEEPAEQFLKAKQEAEPWNRDWSIVL